LTTPTLATFSMLLFDADADDEEKELAY